MKLFKFSQVVFLLLFAFQGALLAAEPPGVSLQILRNRNKDTAGGDYDDKTQKVRLTAVIQNEELSVVEGLKLDVLLIGEVMDDEIKDGERFVLLDRQVQEVVLQPGETLRKELMEIELKFDESSAARFGERYYGYLARIIQKDGTVIWDDSDKQKLKGNFEAVAKIGLKQQFDKKLKPVK